LYYFFDWFEKFDTRLCRAAKVLPLLYQQAANSIKYSSWQQKLQNWWPKKILAGFFVRIIASQQIILPQIAQITLINTRPTSVLLYLCGKPNSAAGRIHKQISVICAICGKPQNFSLHLQL
jgi:hypothetical protein